MNVGSIAGVLGPCRKSPRPREQHAARVGRCAVIVSLAIHADGDEDIEHETAT